MMFYDIARLIEIDRQHKPGGRQYDDTAVKLQQLYDDCAQQLILAHLKLLQVGNPANTTPLGVSVLKRIVDAQSVVYRTPPTRRLVVDGVELEDSRPAAMDAAEVFESMYYDLAWALIDRARNLHRQVAVVLQESPAHGCVQLRQFEPYNVRRHPNPMAPDLLSEDYAVAFQTRVSCGEEAEEGDHYQLWIRDDGGWNVAAVDGTGTLLPTQPYPDRRSPFGATLPAVMVYDEPPRGRAWLPHSEARVAYALNIDAIVNDLMYLVKQEAHTTIAVATDDQRGLPTETGPGKIWRLPEGSSASTLATNPKISESGALLDQVLRLWATAESLPGDTFDPKRQVHTGAALKVQERPLEARRQRQVPMVCVDERRLYDALRVVHNTFASAMGAPPLPAATLRVTAGRAWQPVDPGELQGVAFKDIAIGAASVIDYRQERYGETRAQAIRAHERVQRDRELYPVQDQQNPGALVDGGPHAATGEGGAQKVDGAFNPELATSTDGASLTDAVRVRIVETN